MEVDPPGKTKRRKVLHPVGVPIPGPRVIIDRIAATVVVRNETVTFRILDYVGTVRAPATGTSVLITATEIDVAL